MTLKRGVLWDMDGVLVDTAEFHFQVRQFVTQLFDGRLEQLYQLVTRHF